MTPEEEAAKKKQEEEAAAARRAAQITGGLSASGSGTLTLGSGTTGPAPGAFDARAMQAAFLEQERQRRASEENMRIGTPAAGAAAAADAGIGAAQMTPLPTTTATPGGPTRAMPEAQSSIFSRLASDISAFRGLVGQIQFVDRPQFVQSSTIPVDPNDAIRERYVQAFAQRQLAAAFGSGGIGSAASNAPSVTTPTAQPRVGPSVNAATAALQQPAPALPSSRPNDSSLTYRPSSASGIAAANSGDAATRPNSRPETLRISF